MLDIHEWLPVAAILMVLLQATESVKVKSTWLAALYCSMPLMIALGADQFLIDYSIVQVHEFVAQYGKLVAGLLLLEALLIAFGRVKAPLVIIGGLLSLLYLQMNFYQAGWFNWPFALLALAFGAAGSFLMFACRALPQNHKTVAQLLCCWLFLVIATAYASFPASSDAHTSPLQLELIDAVKSVGLLLIVAAIGYLSFLIPKQPHKKGVGI